MVQTVKMGGKTDGCRTRGWLSQSSQYTIERWDHTGMEIGDRHAAS